MQFQIKVMSVDIQTKPTAKGSYQMATLAYRNESSGKLEEKKLVSFTDKELFSVAAAAQQGSVYTITAEKGEKYWEWKKMEQSTGVVAGNAPEVQAKKDSFPGRTYETADERAERQVLIVRQSSLSSAVASLTAGVKSPPSADDVLALAQRYSDWVFQKEAKVAVNSIFSAAELADLPNDL